VSHTRTFSRRLRRGGRESSTSRARRAAAAWLLAAVGTLGACGPGAEAPRSASDGPSPPEPTATPWSESSRWIDVYEPELTASGYNLVIYNDRTPVLMDMNGTVVHAWEGVQAVDRARLLPSGDLAVIVLRGPFAVYDWRGEPKWSFDPRGKKQFLHHDFVRLRNGNWLLLVRDHDAAVDILLEVDSEGREVWQWDPRDFIAEDLPRSLEGYDQTHVNSVEEIPSNRWFDAGHEAFRPGNILISARNLNALYVIAKSTGEIVWRYEEGLDYQHEARMVPAGFPGEGNIVFFNNGYHNLAAYRRSSIVEVDPIERRVVWRYSADRFFTSVEGIHQILENGNLLVTSTHSGRVFELTREGRIVWQWAPPFDPSRLLRYAYDSCPQLAALDPPVEQEVRRRDPAQYLDRDIYAFARVHERRAANGPDGPIWLLKEQSGCRTLRLPSNPTLEVGYGVETPQVCRGAGQSVAQFKVAIRSEEDDTNDTVLARGMDLEGDDRPPSANSRLSLRQERLALERYGEQTVDLCLTLSTESGAPPPPCFVWEVPRVRSADEPLLEERKEASDPEIERIQRERLEAIGYIN
jgi:outer membrane protein assembly factor BamB